jgi:hypothetical protein
MVAVQRRHMCAKSGNSALRPSMENSDPDAPLRDRVCPGRLIQNFLKIFGLRIARERQERARRRRSCPPRGRPTRLARRAYAVIILAAAAAP